MQQPSANKTRNWKEKTHLRHSAIDHKVRSIDETALVAGEEDHGLGQLDGLAEAAGWEVNLAAVTFGRVVAEPILEEGSAVGAGVSFLNNKCLFCFLLSSLIF